MANEIQATYDTGVTLYTLVFNAAGQVWRNNAPQQFLVYAPGAIGVYDIPLSEIATNSGQYRANWPVHVNMIAGVYSVVLFEQAGGSPVAADDDRIGETGKMIWDGSAEIDLDDIEAYVDKIDDATDGLTAIKAEVEGIGGITPATAANVATALTNYDGPTKVEMDTAHDLLATEAKQDIIGTNVDTILAKANLITTGQLIISSPVSADEEIIIVQGDDYLDANGTDLEWTSEAWTSPDLTSATAKLRFVTKEDYDDGVQASALEVDVTITWAGSGNDVVFTADLTAAQTAALSSPTPPNDKYSYVYQLQVTTNAGKKITVALGSVYVKQEIL